MKDVAESVLARLLNIAKANSLVYNELLMRGYSVDVGVVEYQYRNSEKKKTKVQLEVDFIARTAGDMIYIQSALHIDSDEKREQEIHSLKRINDSFQKIISCPTKMKTGSDTSVSSISFCRTLSKIPCSLFYILL